MIVTLTMNPCVDLNMVVDKILFETPLRAIDERKRAGGKGINVSDALSILGVPSIAVAPVGGPGGQEFVNLAQSRLDLDKITLKTVEIGGNTRTNTVITSAKTNKHIKVNQQGPIFTDEMIENVVYAIDETIQPRDVLALCGSLPKGVEPGFYARLVKRYRDKGAFVVVDADGDAFREALKEKPHAVKPNRDELAQWISKPLESEAEFEEAAKAIVQQTDGICLASDGAKRALLASPLSLLSLTPIEAHGSPVGAGDCSLAGLLSGITEGGDPFQAIQNLQTLSEAFHLATCCGTASASTPDTESFTPALLADVLQRTPRPVALSSQPG